MPDVASVPDHRSVIGTSPLLSVVVPVRDEGDSILPLISEIRAALNGLDYEIVYVDDGSTDETGPRLAAAAASGVRLRHLRHATGLGQSAAIRSGVRAATGGWIATLDGDGQNDPADILRLWEQVGQADRKKSAPVLVTGERASRQDRLVKRLSSRLANALRARVLADGTADSGCGLKLFRRDAFLDLPQFDHMHRFLPALFLRAGGRVVSVPVVHRPRLRGRSHYGILDRLWVGLLDLAGVFWLQRRVLRGEAEEIGGPRSSCRDSA